MHTQIWFFKQNNAWSGQQFFAFSKQNTTNRSATTENFYWRNEAEY